jgi:hypothetical protein
MVCQLLAVIFGLNNPPRIVFSKRVKSRIKKILRTGGLSMKNGWYWIVLFCGKPRFNTTVCHDSINPLANRSQVYRGLPQQE